MAPKLPTGLPEAGVGMALSLPHPQHVAHSLGMCVHYPIDWVSKWVPHPLFPANHSKTLYCLPLLSIPSSPLLSIGISIPLGFHVSTHHILTLPFLAPYRFTCLLTSVNASLTPLNGLRRIIPDYDPLLTYRHALLQAVCLAWPCRCLTPHM